MPFSCHSERAARPAQKICLGMALLFLTVIGSALAAPAYTFDLGSHAQTPLPAWLDPIQRQDNGSGVGQLEIQVRPPQNASHLALTLIYVEKAGETLSVTWQAEGEAPYVLATNLLGTLDGVHDQKTLLIDQALVGIGGKLVIGYSSAAVIPSKIKVDWVSSGTVLTSDADTLPALMMNSGQQVSQQGLTGESFAADPDKAGEKVADALLVGPAESLDEPLEIEMPVGAPAQGARLSAAVLGIPLNAGVSAYINDVYVGELQIEMPGLDDPGYDFSNNGASYAGWRNATLTVPGSALKEGSNTITFAPSATDAQATLTEPAYLRNGRLQIIYQSP